MADIQDLINVLEDGKANAQHAKDLETALGMDTGNTQEPTRDLIRDAILRDGYPIGSIPDAGYFLINTEQEYQKTVSNLEARAQGLQHRIEAITRGWEQRKESRASGGNWPK